MPLLYNIIQKKYVYFANKTAKAFSSVRTYTVALTLAALSFAGAGCKARKFNDSQGNSTKVNSDRSINVEWQCSSKTKEGGFFTQEEYCQWTRRSRAAGKHLRCEFTTNFDMTRPAFLTKETNIGKFEKNDYNNGKDVSGNPFTKVFSNSQAFLVGGEEPRNSRNAGTQRAGLIPTCAGQTTRRTIGVCHNDITCVCDRKSDPQLCAVVGAVTKAGCTAKPVASAATKNSVLPFAKSGVIDKPLVAVTLNVGKSLKPYCAYKNQFNIDSSGNEVAVDIAGVDPATEKTYVSCFLPSDKETHLTSCDMLADSILAQATIQAEGSCDIATLMDDLDGTTPDACR
jgi:hypothetical protein